MAHWPSERQVYCCKQLINDFCRTDVHSRMSRSSRGSNESREVHSPIETADFCTSIFQNLIFYFSAITIATNKYCTVNCLGRKIFQTLTWCSFAVKDLYAKI